MRRSNRAIDLTNREFERLTVLGVAKERMGRKLAWVCRCKCGNLTVAPSSHLINGDYRSCGCLARDMARERAAEGVGAVKATHRKSGSRIYFVFNLMHERCSSPKNHKHSSYGGRGIRVCERWSGENGFQNFLADMGEPPFIGASIDRKDNNGDYTPDNCRWATKTQQARNRRSNRIVEYQGRQWVLAELAESLGVKYKQLHKWLQKTGSIEEAVNRTGPVASRIHLTEPPRD